MRTIIIFLSCLFVFGYADESRACGACMAALFDQVLPPALTWSLFVAAWYLLVSAVVTFHDESIWGVLSLWKAVLLVLLLVVIGMMMIGPFGIMLLFLPVPAVVQAGSLEGKKIENSGFAKAMKAVNWISLVLFLGLIGYSGYIQKTRSNSDYILKWESTYPSNSLLEKLGWQGEENLPDLRIIVEKGGFSSASIAAQALANFGDPALDLPLVDQKRERCDIDPSCKRYREKFDRAVQKLLEKKNRGPG